MPVARQSSSIPRTSQGLCAAVISGRRLVDLRVRQRVKIAAFTTRSPF
jgi:hypothetical protein